MRRLGKVFLTPLSSWLANRPHLFFRIQQGALRFAFKVLDLKLASFVVRRPEWLLAQSSQTPLRLEPPLRKEIHGDIVVRLIKAYGRADQGAKGIPNESMWGTLIQLHYAEISQLVADGNEANLTEFVGRLFRTRTVDGYTYGAAFSASPHRYLYVPVAIELSVVTLAECIGLLRAECHEQGHIAFWRSIYSEEELIGGLEAYFGLRIEAPRAGDPRGIMFGGRFLTRETCSHLYSAYRMSQHIDRSHQGQKLRIVEIGGGYGGTYYWLRKLLADRIERYVIVDLPEVNLVQGFFLGATAEVTLYGETRRANSAELIPHFKIDEISFAPNILINQDSMPEMPESEVVRYLSWASDNVAGLFISFNQETLSPWAGVAQVHVASVAAGFSRFKRISRETSWDRRGYVEEIYEINSHN